MLIAPVHIYVIVTYRFVNRKLYSPSLLPISPVTTHRNKLATLGLTYTRKDKEIIKNLDKIFRQQTYKHL